MKNNIKVATTVAIIALLGGVLSGPAYAFDFSDILQNLTRGLSGWTELDARQGEIGSQLTVAESSGQLTPDEAAGFRLELARNMQVEAQIKASGRNLGATEAISFTNSLNNLTNRIQAAVNSKATANATSLTNVETLRAQLNKQISDARIAHTITRVDADNIKRDLDHNARIQSAFTASGDGTVSARQAQVLNDDLLRIKVAADQQIKVVQAAVPQLTAQRVALEQKVTASLAARTINERQAADFRSQIQRIMNMQTNFLVTDGTLTSNEVLALASELDRLASRVDYQIAMTQEPSDSSFRANSAYGDRGYRGDRGYDDDRGYRGDRGYEGDRGYRGDRGYEGDRGYGANRGIRGQHNLQQIADFRADVLKRITTSQTSGRLSRYEASKLRAEYNRIAQNEVHLKAANRGRLSTTQSNTIWTDLTELDDLVTTKLTARTNSGSRRF